MKEAEKTPQPIMYEWEPSATVPFSGQEYSIINNFIKSFEAINFNTGQLSKHQIYPVAIMQNKLRQMIEEGIAKPVYSPNQDVATATSDDIEHTVTQEDPTRNTDLTDAGVEVDEKVTIPTEKKKAKATEQKPKAN